MTNLPEWAVLIGIIIVTTVAVIVEINLIERRRRVDICLKKIYESLNILRHQEYIGGMSDLTGMINKIEDSLGQGDKRATANLITEFVNQLYHRDRFRLIFNEDDISEICRIESLGKELIHPPKKNKPE